MTQTIAIAAIAVLAIITTIVTVFLASAIRKCFELSARLDDSETARISANEKCVEVSAQLHALNDINSEQKKRITEAGTGRMHSTSAPTSPVSEKAAAT